MAEELAKQSDFHQCLFLPDQIVLTKENQNHEKEFRAIRSRVGTFCIGLVSVIISGHRNANRTDAPVSRPTSFA